MNLQSVLENRCFCRVYAVLVLVTAQCVQSGEWHLYAQQLGTSIWDGLIFLPTSGITTGAEKQPFTRVSFLVMDFALLIYT